MTQIVSIFVPVLFVASLSLALLAPIRILAPLGLAALVVMALSILVLIRIGRKTKWTTFTQMQNHSLSKKEMRVVAASGVGVIWGVSLIVVAVFLNIHVGIIGKMDNPPKVFGK